MLSLGRNGTLNSMLLGTCWHQRQNMRLSKQHSKQHSDIHFLKYDTEQLTVALKDRLASNATSNIVRKSFFLEYLLMTTKSKFRHIVPRRLFISKAQEFLISNSNRPSMHKWPTSSNLWVCRMFYTMSSHVIWIEHGNEKRTTFQNISTAFNVMTSYTQPAECILLVAFCLFSTQVNWTFS